MGVDVEMTPVGTQRSNDILVEESLEENPPNIDLRRQNRCFAIACACIILSGLVYGLTAIYTDSTILLAGSSVGNYDKSSGEIGLDAKNSIQQEIIDATIEDNDSSSSPGKKSKFMKDLVKQFGDKEAGSSKAWVTNSSWWADKANDYDFKGKVDKDKLEKLKSLNNIKKISKEDRDKMIEEFKDSIGKFKNLSLPAQNSEDGKDEGKDGGEDKKKEEDEKKDENETTEPQTEHSIVLNPVSKVDGKMFEALKEIPHDKTSFTQGLTFANGILYESDGLYGESKIRRLDRTTGEVLTSVGMDPGLFAEGMTFFGDDKLIQITWKAKKGFIYDANTLKVLSNYTYTTTKDEGWGITLNPTENVFIVSDGSPYLHFWDVDALNTDNPKVVETRQRLKVSRQNGMPANGMNELEFWEGYVLANIFLEDTIVMIDPKTGECKSEYDFSELWPRLKRRKEGANVLNGISITERKDVLIVTGKRWNRLWEIRLLSGDS